MGMVDLECVATGLPILAGPEPRCVFFLLAGAGDELALICLPVAGRWNGYYPELDDGWHEAALLARLDARWPPTSPSDPTTSNRALFDIVQMTLSGETYPTRRLGQRVVFRAALESCYDVIASGELDPQTRKEGESLADLYRRTVSRGDLLDGLYATEPERELRHACERFVGFRRWFDTARSWSDAGGSFQLVGSEKEDMLDKAERRIRREGGPHAKGLAAALEAYRAEVASEEVEEEEAGAPSSFEDRHEAGRLESHVRETLLKRPGIDALALAGSIEIFRMIQSIPPSVLPGSGDTAKNKDRWRQVIERVGTSDVPLLVAALRAPLRRR